MKSSSFVDFIAAAEPKPKKLKSIKLHGAPKEADHDESERGVTIIPCLFSLLRKCVQSLETESNASTRKTKKKPTEKSKFIDLEALVTGALRWDIWEKVLRIIFRN